MNIRDAISITKRLLTVELSAMLHKMEKCNTASADEALVKLRNG